MGTLSAKAQGLKQAITSSIKFLGSDHRIFIKVKENLALGFMKVGEKKLFYRDYVLMWWNLDRENKGTDADMRVGYLRALVLPKEWNRQSIKSFNVRKYLKNSLLLKTEPHKS